MNITSLPSATALAQNQSSVDHQNSSKTLPSSDARSGLSSRAPDPRQSALDLVEQTLAKAYEKLGLRMDKPAGSTYPGFEPLTAEKVADNILGFISRRLQMDLADGATPEQLQSRLDAGLSGFKKGFAEASEKLQALNMLSPEIKQDIGRTYDLVLQGIERLQQQFIPDKTSASRSSEPTPAVQSTTAIRGSYQYARANSFSFELMTAEGDRITISAASNHGFSANYATAGQGSFSASQSVSATSNSLSWSVEGDLNERELNAINNLLGQINRLAGEFFNGSLDEAFNQALALGYDSEQIATFSLSLMRVEVQKVSAAYQTFNDRSAEGVNLAEKLIPLGHFVKHLLETVEQLKNFPYPKNLVADAAEKMIDSDLYNGDQPGQRFRLFIEQILNSTV